MDIQLTGFFASAISTVMVHVLLCMLLFDSFRFSKKISCVFAAAGFTILYLPQFFLPGLAAYQVQGINFANGLQVFYWAFVLPLEYGLILLLTKRQWLRNLFLYMLGDIILSVFYGFGSVLLDLFGNHSFLHIYGIFFSKGILLLSALAAALIIRLFLKQRMRLNRRVTGCLVLLYTLLRIFFTAFQFTVSSRGQAVFVWGIVLLTVLLLLAGLLLARFCVLRYIRVQQERCWKQLQTESGAEMPLKQELRQIERQCEQYQIAHRINAIQVTPIDEKRLVCLLDLVSRLLIERCAQQPLKRRTFLLSIQQQMHYTIVSMECTAPSGRNPRQFLKSLRQSLSEVVLNRMIRDCDGRIEFLDGEKGYFQIRFICPSAG